MRNDKKTTMKIDFIQQNNNFTHILKIIKHIVKVEEIEIKT